MRYGRQAEREGAAAVSIAAIPRVFFFELTAPWAVFRFLEKWEKKSQSTL